MWNKSCPKCKKQEVVKNGIKRGKQAYKSNNCKYRFVSKSRDDTRTTKKLWKEYSVGKQTYKELETKYWVSKKTIARKFDAMIKVKYLFYAERFTPISTYVVIDATWFWKDLCIIMVKSSEYKRVIYAKVVSDESLEWYREAKEYLYQKWWKFLWLTSDWFRWIQWLFPNIPFQLCHFHQVANVTKYITKYPKLQANKDLRSIILSLKKSSCEEFYAMILNREEKYKDFLNEKTQSLFDVKRKYTHERTRKALRSIRRNMRHLFTFEEHRSMPKTTNMLDWYFSPLKWKVWVHPWLSISRKIRLVFELLNQY